MANQQAFQTYSQNEGTLTPGQTISVNKHTVQVERYLSQGGFAHVYLVRTPTPVYNTTHHVLKRIQVSDESMLTEVRKEVDVMRLLKGHPNIVHLIDAAWHKMPIGMFEVFILMEYCPGGGIIDMMNRRLRERLTEAEILQIFVDVCEGVAYMHNLRPPVLHRDLKVENILQSTSTSFKLCDFGSATNVGHPPTNTQEIRNLEADLNRHTTLQYRAPEMVDVYSKRPINEKSDVWALGVLLYKLCYYTTPFEEHGPLAIINVQYRTPPFPSYSQDMNMLIASMLREHGAQRPTVFELLAHVHRLRGTKSKFSYNIPALVPRAQQPEFRLFSSPNSFNNVITYTSPPAKSADSSSRQNQSPVNQGIQARDRVLEAIAPMRRGRPDSSRDSKNASSSGPPSPQKTSAPKLSGPDKSKNWLDSDFGPEQDTVWKTATEHNLAGSTHSLELGWSIGDGQKPQKEKLHQSTGFGDNFPQNVLNSLDSNLLSPVPPRLSPRPNLTATITKPIRPLAHTGGVSRPNQSRDAFEGLGLMTTNSRPPPTMGEARKLRTGLAMINAPIIPGDYKRYDNKFSSSSRQPSLSPRPNHLSTTRPHSKAISPNPTPLLSLQASGSIASTSRITNGLTIESRFPSLEELDARVIPSHNVSGVRSQQVTGIAMRESKQNRKPESEYSSSKPSPSDPDYNLLSSSPRDIPSRSVPLYKHRTTMSMQPNLNSSRGVESSESTSYAKIIDLEPLRLSARPSHSGTSRDWLTGDDDHEDIKVPAASTSFDVPVLRRSPSKRASYIELDKLELVAAQHVVVHDQPFQEPLSADSSPTVSKFKRTFPALETIDPQSLQPTYDERTTKDAEEDSSSADEGPEDPRRLRSAALEKPSRARGRQSSVHDLVYQYGGRVTPKEKEHKRVPQQSTVRPSGLVLPTKPHIDRKTPSPASKPLMSPTRRSLQYQQSSTQANRSQLKDSKTPTPGRPRPQSMFIFPSKSIDNSSIPSPGLVPPEESAPRAVRRTSISDLVDRYEAIGGKAKLGGPPSPLPKSIMTAKTTAEPQKPSISTSSKNVLSNSQSLFFSKPSMSSDFSHSDIGSDSSKSQSVSMEPPRQATRSPTKPRRSLALEKAELHTQLVDNTTPRPRRVSRKAEPSEQVVSQSVKAPSEVDTRTNPPRKSSLFGTDSLPQKSEDRSSSPERPYQGVGRLIDQWQKKSAEADSQSTLSGKRGGFVAKRVAIVNGDDERGQ